MRVCGISDLHGTLDFSIKPCDVLCICGDILPLSIQGLYKPSFEWLKGEFLEWCNNQPCKEVLLVAGNHDMTFEGREDEIRKIFRGSKVRYLLDEVYEYISVEDGKVVTFYGTPWCHPFGFWAFMSREDGKPLFDTYMNMPDNVDVLLTHDAPHGTSDVCLQKTKWTTGEHIGCMALKEAVVKKQPHVHLHGHLHSTNHQWEQLGKTNIANVSIVDETYKLAFDPLYFNI